MQQELLINRNLPIITTAIDSHIPDRVETCEGTTHARTTPTTKQVITDAALSSAHVLRTPGHVNRMGRDDNTPRERNVSGMEKGPVLIGGNTIFPTGGIMGIQEIVIMHGSTGSVEIRDTQKLDTSINRNLAKNGDSKPIFSKAIGRELSHDSSADIYLRCRVEFMRNAMRTEAPDFMHLGILAVNAFDEIRSFGTS